MPTMKYETPDVTRISFEDSLFATTKLDSRQNETVRKIVEKEGGVFKESVTKTTNYLIYGDGEEETTKYKKALELIRDKGLEITIISWSSFRRLTTMTYITPDVTKIVFQDNTFVTTGLDADTEKEVKRYIESHGGIVKNQISKTTDYLIFEYGNDETTQYKKALKLINENRSEIKLMSLNLFFTVGRGEGLMEFGTYPFEKDGTRRPIRWSVLKRKGNKALLLSAYGLDAIPYNEEWKGVTWETCTLRKWLNEEFLDNAFSAEEQQQIITTIVKNPDNPNYNTPGGNDTEDKVFLLSISEVKKYLPTAFERRLKPTPYAVKNGVYNWYEGNCWWWLRSPGSTPNHAANVDYDGGIYGRGDFVSYGGDAVCPALWVDLKSDI